MGGRRNNGCAASPSYIISRTSSRRSRAKKWMPSTNRTQLQRVHMSSEGVRGLSARKRTPRRRAPVERPAAEVMAVRAAGGGDDHLARRQIIRCVEAGVVLDSDRRQLVDLAAGGGPEL